MPDKPVMHLVGADCPPAMNEKVARWYMEKHIPMLMDFKGLKEVLFCQRLYNVPEYPPFFSLYKFDNPAGFQAYESSKELALARQDLHAQQWKADEFNIKWRVQYETLKMWKQ